MNEIIAQIEQYLLGLPERVPRRLIVSPDVYVELQKTRPRSTPGAGDMRKLLREFCGPPFGVDVEIRAHLSGMTWFLVDQNGNALKWCIAGTLYFTTSEDSPPTPVDKLTGQE